MSEKIKVLVVDDSSLVRKIITDILEKEEDIEVVGTANNGKTAIFKNQELDPDVITMDIEMPILDGLAALKHIMKTKPRPVIMMSVLTQHGADATFKALELGAVDFIPKPSSLLSMSVEEIGDLLVRKVRSVARSKIPVKRETPEIQIPSKFSVKGTSEKVVAIGTSTGGPSALITVFKNFPDKFPSPVLVVQHMPEGFTAAFAKRLNDSSNLIVKEAEDEDDVLPGHGYLAPGHSHMEIYKKGDKYKIHVFKSEKVSGHMPSIDVLFNSVAEHVENKAIGVIMTGMGRDGAEGLLKIKKKGGFAIAQNEETSVVYGMNRVAVEIGATDEIVPLERITERIIKNI
ncbi:MAG TPA: chemotaxis response regulator protein-glutamate methylesterase [Spirochaetota bacterium]|jgi:two-component system chemotaxis response regulator CheB|nr:chemotaxis response regulator protein-glutamate methylesterase [Spirochaetota bacterium]HON15906.1 chemotaxis response regulator protein-glutamate methylesterase [Spirochaetota bacterium]HPD78698.1 chemotaxis response regulator protein-glutamate methylesterase [Spirochaetota bacterium]HRS61999.1 chemotaxis response regulator protein-glutamate methylesterase [Spirochaetota bacterium]HRU64609.1 chemotaxis response regulator protein-glutamate methylesterase [Spirochaetota bacterium]